MKDKSILIQLAELKSKERELQNEIKDEVKLIFGKYKGSHTIQFHGSDVWIELNEGEVIDTRIISDLNNYFQIQGRLSYSEFEGFILAYELLDGI